MRFVIQRVKEAYLKVDEKLISEIGKGFVVFMGVKKGDDEKRLDLYAKKIANLRIFEDENGKMNYSIKDVKGEILLVSQFTLLADTSHGNRPSFFDAESPQKANEIYLKFAKKLQENEVPARLGVFGADMKILQLNDGPTTIILDL